MDFYALCLRFRVSASVRVTDGRTSDKILGPPPSSPDLIYNLRFPNLRITLKIIIMHFAKTNSPGLQLEGADEYGQYRIVADSQIPEELKLSINSRLTFTLWSVSGFLLTLGLKINHM